MALVLNDRTLETTTTTGTGSFALAGAVQDYQSFSSGVGVGNTTYYSCVNTNTGEWEVGIGTLSGTTTLVRTTLIDSSTGSAIDFTAGTKLIFCTYPASKSVNLDATGVLAGRTQGAAAGAGTVLPQSIAQFFTNTNNYTQFSLQNLNSGISASADYVITADNGNDTSNFSDMGLASSTYSYASFSIILPLDAYYFVNGGNLLLGTATVGKIIKFFQGGTLTGNEVARFAPTSNNLLVGTTVDTGSKVRAAGVVESTTGGFKYPDGTVQLTASTAFKAIPGGLNVGLQTLPGVGAVSLITTYGQYLGLFTTTSPHNLNNHSTVTITDSNPTAYNGSFSVQVINATQFAVVYAANPGAYTAGATLTSYFPVTGQSFTFADAAVTTSSVVSIVPSASTANSAYGGDELEMDDICVAASCTTNGTINVYISTNNGPIAGIRNFNYSLS